MATETSMEAHSQLKASKVRHDYGIILRAISSLREANNSMIAQRTGLKINIVCARMNELRNKFANSPIEFVGNKQCPINGTTTQFWRIKA